MRNRFTMGLAAMTALVFASPAVAHGRYYHHHHRYRHVGYHRHSSEYTGVMRDVLVANPYGDVIVDGQTGLHRSDLGVMVPNSAPPSFVATGRASRSGVGGASGIPGQNF